MPGVRPDARTQQRDSRYLDLVTRGPLWSVNKLDDAHLKLVKKVLLDETPTRAK
jgi:hypothetical protein